MIMNRFDYLNLLKQLHALKEVARDYPGKTIENVIVQIEARIKEFEQINSLNYGKEKAN